MELELAVSHELVEQLAAVELAVSHELVERFQIQLAFCLCGVGV